MALINCPECNHETSDTAKKCNNCGFKVAKFLKDKEVCPDCKSFVKKKAKKCDNCGANRKKPMSTLTKLILFLILFPLFVAPFLPEQPATSNPNPAKAKSACTYKTCKSVEEWKKANPDKISAAQVACRTVAENNWGYEIDWSWGAFYTTNNHLQDLRNGKISMLETDSKIQNAFGAFRKTELICIVDIVKDTTQIIGL